jgi:probable rRNA maturation factor
MNATVDACNASTAVWLPSSAAARDWVERTLALAGSGGPSTVSLRYVDSSESRELNHRYRGQDKPTNVLSFPSKLPEPVRKALESNPLGDIVICPEVLESEARDQDKAQQDHWAHLLVHGVLHLIGYDHQSAAEAEAMEALEIRILADGGIGNPYLEPGRQRQPQQATGTPQDKEPCESFHD